MSSKCEEITNKFMIDIIDPSKNSNELSNDFQTLMEDATSVNFYKKENGKEQKFTSNKWFNNECKTAKRFVSDYAKYNDISEDPYNSTYYKMEREYKRIKQKCKRQFQNIIRLKFYICKSNYPKAYRKLWKSLKLIEPNNSKLTLDQFNCYIKKLIILMILIWKKSNIYVILLSLWMR